MERLDDPRLARRFVTSRLLYRRLRRYLWAPPLVLAAIALLLRLEFVVDGLGHVFRSPRQQRAPTCLRGQLVLAVPRHRRRSPSRCWRCWRGRGVTSRGIWRALGGEGSRLTVGIGRRPGGPSPRALAAQRRTARMPRRHPAGHRGWGQRHDRRGALVPELTHLDTGFFACPGATSEVVHEHRGRFGLPPRSCTTARRPPSRSRRERTCTSASCRPRSICRWPPWASG
jgi:hypothetical protein